ncbi:MAG: ribosome biogenesis GTPase Der [Planctomycetota bacterium]
MPLPRVAIVGRPNVGKSSLVNLMAHAKVSIVDDLPGVTRDRVSVIVEIEHPQNAGPVRHVELIDTGGFGVYTAEGQQVDDAGKDLAALTDKIEWQIAEAVATADLVLFAVDVQAGITPRDQEIATMLREQRLGSQRRREKGSVPVAVVGTKTDGPKWEVHGYELSALGFGEPLMISSKNNYFRRDFLDKLYSLVPEVDSTPEPPTDMKLAIVGKRNAGKSTLINSLAGEERVIVSEIAGTTRDAVDVRFDFGDRVITAIDTAGLRKKKSFSGRVEWWALERLERSLNRADAALFMIDATQQISHVDDQLAAMVIEAGTPVVIVINKWDIAGGAIGKKGKPVGPEDYETYLRKTLRGLAFAPVTFMSATEGLNVRETVDLAFEMRDQGRVRMGTGELNRVIQRIITTRGPSNKLGQQARVYYAAQTGVRPPTITLVVNNPDLFSNMYQRFLMNRFREELPFGEVPIRLRIKGRKRTERGKPRGYDTGLDADRPVETAAFEDNESDAAILESDANEADSRVFTDADWAGEMSQADVEALFDD